MVGGGGWGLQGRVTVTMVTGDGDTGGRWGGGGGGRGVVNWHLNLVSRKILVSAMCESVPRRTWKAGPMSSISRSGFVLFKTNQIRITRLQ